MGPATRKAEIKKRFPKGIEKLEIGSGNNPEDGYVHLDIQAGLPDLDILSDVRKMPLPDDFINGEIRAVHIMEHFCHPKYAGKEMIDRYGTTVEVLEEMHRVLAPGGYVKIVTPDFEKICQSKEKGRIDDVWLQRWTVGGHLDEYDVHHWLWTMHDAQTWLSEVGFVEVADWNPIQGFRAKRSLKWGTPAQAGNMEWHRIEWFHWLFVEAKKPS